MAEFTISALSQKLKQTHKDLKKIKRQLFFYQALNAVRFNRRPVLKYVKLKSKKETLNKCSYLLFGALENRKNAIQNYQQFRQGKCSDKSFIVFSFLRYQYFKKKLQKQR